LTTKIWLRYILAQILEPKLFAHEILKFAIYSPDIEMHAVC